MARCLVKKSTRTTIALPYLTEKLMVI